MAFYLKFLIIVEIKSAGQVTAHSANYDHQWTEFEEMDNQANVEPVMASKCIAGVCRQYSYLFRV